jgi:hypothetical protein
MSLNILIIEKTGVIKELALKTFSEAELYKKAGFKTATGFELQTEWGAEIQGKAYSVSLYGKTDGRAGQENKYELPPPLDNVLFFGSCILVNRANGLPKSITKDEWKTVYDHLYGGFEDLDDDDDDDEEEDDEDEDVPRTKEGYVKDDFVVDDDEDEEDYDEEEDEDEDEESDESSEEEIVIKTRSSKKTAKSPVTKKAASAKDKKVQGQQLPEVLVNNYLDCTSELSEEEYV